MTFCIEKSIALGVAISFLSVAAPTLAQNSLNGTLQSYPIKPVRIITAGAGTLHDLVTRHIGQRLSDRWKQPVIVENQPAAGLTIGSAIAARATPDGYTLLMADRTALATAPSLYKGLTYDPVKDFAPITLVARAPQLLVAHSSVPAANLKEFIEFAKRQQGGFNFGTAGPGTATHVSAELLKLATGINLVPVQYKGGGAQMIATVSGEVKAGFVGVAVAQPHMVAGRIKAYAVASRKRSSGAPDIPTATEAGLPDFESEQWIGMVAPARVSANLLSKLNLDFVDIIQASAMRDALLSQGAEPAAGTSTQFAAFISSQAVKMRQLIADTGMRAD